LGGLRQGFFDVQAAHQRGQGHGGRTRHRASGTKRCASLRYMYLRRSHDSVLTLS
jgi:hypothetical protein